MPVKVRVDIADSTYQQLLALAESKGKTPGEALRDALSLALYWDDVEKQGGRFLRMRSHWWGSTARELRIR